MDNDSVSKIILPPHNKSYKSSGKNLASKDLIKASSEIVSAKKDEPGIGLEAHEGNFSNRDRKTDSGRSSTLSIALILKTLFLVLILALLAFFLKLSRFA